MTNLFTFIILFSLNLSAALSVPKQIEGESLITGTFQSVAVTDSKLKGTAVVFMSSKCPCSNSHVGLIKKLSAQYKDFQFVVVHSNTDEPAKEAAEYFKKAGFTFAVIQDDGLKIADQFKAFKTPHSFLIDAKGEVVYQGGVTDSSNADAATKNYLADALKQVSENKAVSVAQGRTLGCVIVR